MTESERAVWKFAVENPDYWPLLRTDDATPELAALSDDDRAAFSAARRVAQDRAVSLLRRCWDDLGKRAEGTTFYGMMADTKQRATILQNKMGDWLPENKGTLLIGIWGSRGTLSLWVTVHLAKKRLAEASAAWKLDPDPFVDDVLVEDTKVHFRRPIDATLSDAEVSTAFTAQYWPRLARYLKVAESATAAELELDAVDAVGADS